MIIIYSEEITFLEIRKSIIHIKQKKLIICFNEVTKFGYPNNRSNLNEVRNKQMLIILDNTDEFFIHSVR